MRRFLLLLFVCYASFTFGQNLDQIGKVPLVKVNGGVSANSVFYEGSANREALTYFVNGNLNFNISGIYNLPLSFSYTNQDFNYSTPFKINRLSIHPSYKWIATHIGDVAMTFSPYTVSGHQFTGGGVDLTPSGPFKISALYGRFLKSVEYNDSIPEAIPTYQRIGYGLKTSYDFKKFDIGLTFFKAKDKQSSLEIPIPEEINVDPKENLVVSLESTLEMINNLVFHVEVAQSAVTENLNDEKTGENKNFLGYLIDEKVSTNYYTALNANFTYTLGKGTITVTDSKSCSRSQNYTVGRYEFDTVSSTELTCGNSDASDDDGSITARVKGGIANYSYELFKKNELDRYESTGDQGTLEAGQDFEVFGLSDGDYRIQVTDRNNRIISVDRTIDPIAVFDFATIPTDVTCKGGDDGTISLSVTGGTTPYNISWSGPDDFLSTGQNLTNLIAGVYTLTLTDANGCSPQNSNFTVIVEEPPTSVAINVLSINSPSEGNSDGSIFIEEVPGYSYEWNTGQTTSAISNLMEGTYTVTVRDSKRCPATETIVLEALAVRVAVPSGEEVLCHEDLGVLTANATGGDGQYTYTWYDQNDPSNILGSTATIRNLEEGIYYVSVRDKNGAGTVVTSDPFSISIPDPVLISDIIATPVNCYAGSDGTLTIIASGGIGELLFSIDSGVTYQTSNQFSGLNENTYQVIVKDENGCESDIQEVSIEAPQDPIAVDSTVTDVTIFGENTGSIEVIVNGGNGDYTFNWSGPDGFTATSKNINNLYEGTYTLVITDKNFYITTDFSGCTLTQSFTITEPDVLEVMLNYETAESDLKCFGDDNARLLATTTGGVPPYTYQWFKKNTDGIFDPLNDTSELFIGADSGEYEVRISDASGAVASATFEVGSPDPISVIYNTINISCYGDATGAIDITVSGGTPPYTYQWSNGAITEDIDELLEGNYEIIVTDSQECSESFTIEVMHLYEELKINSLELVNVSTFEGSDGSITLELTGGLAPYDITWTRLSDGALMDSDTNLTNLIADDYQVLIKDNLGCELVETFTITQPDIVDPTIIIPTCVGGCDANIDILVNEGQGSFEYLWDTGATTKKIINLCAGTYTVLITGFDNRVLERSYTVVDPDPIEIDLDEEVVLCKDQSINIDATINDPGASYRWESNSGFAANTAEVTLSESGDYTVYVTTSLGCITSETITVLSLDNEISAEFIVSSDLYTGEPFTMVDVSNPLPDLITWSLPDEATAMDITDEYAEILFSKAGEYDIIMTSTLGDCITSFTKKITVRDRSFGPAVENEDLMNYQLYPNPSSGNFTVDLLFNKETAVNFKVYSMVNTKELYHYQDDGKYEYRIPFTMNSVLPAGLYFIILEIPGKSYVRKIIVE